MTTDCRTWLCRKTVNDNKKDGIDRHVTVKYELVWGESIDGKINGDTHHSLSGDAGRRSISDMADRLNKSGYKPPKNKPITRADGLRNPTKF
jgi:hypothetical protein